MTFPAQIRAIGIDLGGTKSEVQVFGQDWVQIASRRDETPDTYDALVRLLIEQASWASGLGGEDQELPIPIGIGSAGVFDGAGLAYAANLPIRGKPFVADVQAAIGSNVRVINDANALGLSEAKFGAGQGFDRVVGVIFGTGMGGSVVDHLTVLEGPSGLGGEFGLLSVPASVLDRHTLPIWQAPSGKAGCYEAYLAGPGLQRLIDEQTDLSTNVKDFAALRETHAEAERVWRIWVDIAAQALSDLVLTLDPDCFVIAGGLSKIDGIDTDLSEALRGLMFNGHTAPPVLIAQGGDASGARGAAFAAWSERAKHG